jgi:hypothetical protein
MKRLSLALVFVAAFLLSPGAQASVTQGACNASHPPRTADVHYSDGSCVRYTLSPTAPAWEINFFRPLYSWGLTVASVQTGAQAAVWVCDADNPLGWTQSPYAPCWSGGNIDLFRRVRGPMVNGVATPAPLTTISGVTGRSFVVTAGKLQAPPVCPYVGNPSYPQPFNFYRCPSYGYYSSDSGLNDWTANYDPSNATNCCNESGVRPDGVTSGAPCLAYGGDGNYAIINYACPVY